MSMSADTPTREATSWVTGGLRIRDPRSKLWSAATKRSWSPLGFYLPDSLSASFIVYTYIYIYIYIYSQRHRKLCFHLLFVHHVTISPLVIFPCESLQADILWPGQSPAASQEKHKPPIGLPSNWAEIRSNHFSQHKVYSSKPSDWGCDDVITVITREAQTKPGALQLFDSFVKCFSSDVFVRWV